MKRRILQSWAALAGALLLLASPAGAQPGACPARPLLGQLLMVRVPALPTQELRDYRAQLRADNIGGVILFGANFRKMNDPNEVVAFTNFLQAGASSPLFISTDQEGGAVQRLRRRQGFTDMPRFEELGRHGNEELAYAFGQVVGRELASVGVNWNFAPVLDVKTNPDNPMIARWNRALSEDPQAVAELGMHVIRGMQREGVVATAKHFPGVGDARGDSHKVLPAIRRDWHQLNEVELRPFRRAIEEGVAAVLMGHVVTPLIEPESRSASLSKFWIETTLRERLGFEGLVVTDDLDMGAITGNKTREEAALEAILAGNDVLMITGGGEREVLDSLCEVLARRDRTSLKLYDRVLESVDRIERTKARFGIDRFVPLAPLSDKPSSRSHEQVATKIREPTPERVR